MIARRQPIERPSSRFSRVLVACLLIAITVQAATIFDIFWSQATYFSYVVQIVVFVTFLVYPLFRMNVPIFLSAIGIIAFLAAEHVVFCRMAGQPYNFNAILMYIPLISFFSLYRSGCSLRYILNTLAIVVTVYLAVYLIGYDWLINSGASRSVHAGDASRGVRLLLATGFASFLAFYAIAASGRPLALRSVMFLMAVAALYLSGSRMFGMLFLVILALSTLRLLGFGVRLLLFGLFALICGVLLLGFVLPDWNPFGYMAWDGSAYARSLEYRYALLWSSRTWMFGVGIPGTFAQLQTFLKTPLYEPLYATDLGVMGPLFVFGIPGLIAFLAATYFSIVPVIGGREGPEFRSMRLNGILCGMFGVLSPSLLLEQNALFLSILIVAAARGGARTRSTVTDTRLWVVAQPIYPGVVMPLLRKLIRRGPGGQGASHYGPGGSDAV
jgi:hypothetical protein